MSQPERVRPNKAMQCEDAVPDLGLPPNYWVVQEGPGDPLYYYTDAEFRRRFEWSEA